MSESDDLQSLRDEVKALSTRLRELEDVRAIVEIWHHWDWAVTGGFNGHQAGDYQAIMQDYDFEAGTAEGFGLYDPGTEPKGREAVLEYWDYFYGDNGPIPVDFQASTDPAVRIDGDTAKLECNTIIWFMPRGQAPLFGLVKRYVDFIRRPEGWKITRFKLEDGLWMRTPPFDGRTRLNDIRQYIPRKGLNVREFQRPTEFEKNIIRDGGD